MKHKEFVKLFGVSDDEEILASKLMSSLINQQFSLTIYLYLSFGANSSLPLLCEGKEEDVLGGTSVLFSKLFVLLCELLG